MCRDRWSSSAVMQGNKRLQQLTASLSSELRGLTDTEDSNVLLLRVLCTAI